MFEILLVPVDGSPHAKSAVAIAVEMAKCHKSTVHLLHVIRDLPLPKELLDMMAAGEVTASRTQILQDSAHIILNAAREQFNQAGIPEVNSQVAFGDPAAKILDYADECGAELIVLGHRGLHPSDGLLGGVARKVVNFTKIPCLIAS